VGVLTYANGTKLEGKWNFGVKEGKFIYTLPDGKGQFTGNYRDNTLYVTKDYTIVLPVDLPWSFETQTL
jgi:hypothetical protein